MLYVDPLIVHHHDGGTEDGSLRLSVLLDRDEEALPQMGVKALSFKGLRNS